MMRKIAEGSTLGLKYEIYDNTGVVDQVEMKDDALTFKPVEGHHHIRIPEFGVGSQEGNRIQWLHLKGEAENIELEDVTAPACTGEQLTLFSVRQAHHEKGSYFRFFNHSTHQAVDNLRALRDQLFPWASLWSLLSIGLTGVFYYLLSHQERGAIEAFFVTVATMPVLFVPMYLIGLTIGLARMTAVRNNRSFRSYATNLR